MKKTTQCPQVEFIWEHLNDALHQVFLGYWVSTAHCLFKHSWKDMLMKQEKQTNKLLTYKSFGATEGSHLTGTLYTWVKRGLVNDNLPKIATQA